MRANLAILVRRERIAIEHEVSFPPMSMFLGYDPCLDFRSRRRKFDLS